MRRGERVIRGRRKSGRTGSASKTGSPVVNFNANGPEVIGSSVVSANGFKVADADGRGWTCEGEVGVAVNVTDGDLTKSHVDDFFEDRGDAAVDLQGSVPVLFEDKRLDRPPGSKNKRRKISEVNKIDDDLRAEVTPEECGGRSHYSDDDVLCLARAWITQSELSANQTEVHTWDGIRMQCVDTYGSFKTSFSLRSFWQRGARQCHHWISAKNMVCARVGLISGFDSESSSFVPAAQCCYKKKFRGKGSGTAETTDFKFSRWHPSCGNRRSFVTNTTAESVVKALARFHLPVELLLERSRRCIAHLI